MTDNQIIPFEELGIERLNQQQIEQRSPDWYETWRGRIRAWISTHTDDQAAQIILFVPDLLALVVRLARDQRVPFLLKGQLLLAAAYVLSPFDFVPEALIGAIGLADDAGVLMLVLMWIKGLASVDHQVLRENWSGQGDVIDVIERLHEKIDANADRLYPERVWTKLRRQFGGARRPRLSLRRRK
ncbi:MAG: DUF1232 domain-containing protein [Anaerolineae bacterium]|nr:DUF1232 domain-containing protein [Anaerolineae bacterium]